MKSIIISGSCGLIGSHLAKYFLNNGWEVIGIDNLIGGYETNEPNHENYISYYANILDNELLREIFKIHKPDVVIHCAALAHEGLSVFSPKTICESIYTGTVSMCSAAVSCGTVHTFINTTSMARYGDIKPPFTEDMTCNPVDPYGLAKLQAEQHLNLMSDIYGFKVYHLVPHNVAGPNQCYSDPFRNVVSIFTNLILHDKPIYIYGDGKQKRSFSHVVDCVLAIHKLIERTNSLENKSIYNIGPSDGSEITIFELAELVIDILKPEQHSIVWMPERPREVKEAWVSTRKAEIDLQYQSLKSTVDTIKDTVQWIQTQPLRDFKYHLPLEIITRNTPSTWVNQMFKSN